MNLIEYQCHAGTAIIQLNRPNKKNALNHEMYTELNKCLDTALADHDVKSVILTGHEDFFTTGHDLQDFAEAKTPDDLNAVSKFIITIATYAKPIIAAVNGPCIGIGTTLLLHCDLLYAGTETYFHMPFSQLGLTPEAGSSYLLPALMGQQKAAQYLLLGEPFSAKTALELGLVNEIIDKSKVLAHALEKAAVLSQYPIDSLLATKSLLKSSSQTKALSTIQKELPLFFKQLQQPHAQNAFHSFLKNQTTS